MTFNQSNTVEQMILDACQKLGWKYTAGPDLPRQTGDVFVESMLHDAIIRLNPEIAAQPGRADEVIYKLRTIQLSVQNDGLVRSNEALAERIVKEIDEIVRIVHFDGWQSTSGGEREVKKAVGRCCSTTSCVAIRNFLTGRMVTSSSTTERCTAPVKSPGQDPNRQTVKPANHVARIRDSVSWV